jgi:L-threonylcarbamoyladenylate synthase
VDVSRGVPVLLRPGRIGASEIAAAIGVAPRPPDSHAPRAPGTLEAHYAPQRPLRLVPPRELGLLNPSRCGVMSFRSRPAGDASAAWIRAPSDPERYGHDLYANLRALDSSECEEILVEEPPSSAEWSAIRDRLTRARSS